MKAQFTIPGVGVSSIVLEAGNMLVDIAVDNALRDIAHQYAITPLFAGMFGSRPKGYDGPESDFDLYVPYIGQFAQYLRVLDVDTRQLEGKDILPPQITIQVVHKNKPINVQLNFVSFDHYIQELTRNNIDFRMSLDNVLVRYCSQSAITLLKISAHTYVDLENIKHKCLGRASKTVALMKSGKAIKHSEVTDGLYRLLYAAVTMNNTAIKHIYHNRTPTLANLLDAYMLHVERDQQTKTAVEALLATIRAGQWKQEGFTDVLSLAVIDALERVIANIKERPIAIPEQFKLDTNKRIEAQMSAAGQLNKMFVELMLEVNAGVKPT